MSQNIYKHRRGTTQEWLEIDLVPEEGELVIEECSDGSRKCKIGDGFSKFSLLPYVNDSLRIELLHKLDSLSSTVDNKILELSNKTKVDLERTAEASALADTVMAEQLKTEFISADKELKGQVTSSFNQALSSVNEELTNAISESKADLVTEIASVKEELVDKLDATAATAVEAIENLKTTTAQVEDKVEKGLEKVASDIVTEKELRNIQVSELYDKLDTVSVDIKNSIRPSIQKVASDLETKIEVLTDDHKTDLSDLKTETTAALGVLSNTIEKYADSTEEKLGVLDLKISDAINSQLEEFQSTITSATTEIKKEYEDDISAVRTELRQEITAGDSDLKKNVEKLKADLVNAENVLDSAIQQLEVTSTQATKNLAAGLDSLSEKTKKLELVDEALAKRITDAVKAVNDTTTKLADNLKILKMNQAKGYTFISNELIRLSEEHDAAQLNNLNTFFGYITRIYAELADLVDDDLLILEKVFAVDAQVCELLTELDTRLSTQINDLDKKLTTNISEVHAVLTDDLDSINNTLTEDLKTTKTTLLENIETLRTASDIKIIENTRAIESLEAIIFSNQTAVTNKFTEVETSIRKNKLESDADFSEVSKSFETVNTRIDTTNERLDTQFKRLSNLIALTHGSTTGDAELIDIRNGYDGYYYESAGDAVRAVGDDVKALRASLSQYIDTQAIDGLHYDYNGEVGLMQPYMLYLTADGEVIEDSGVQIISGSGGGGGGSSTTSSLKLGYITTSPIVTTTNDTTVLKFTFSGTDSSGDTILQATATWKVNNVTVEYGTVKDGENEFDITKYLSVGTTKVLLVVTDDNGSVVTKSWSIQQLELSVDSSFDDKSTYPAGEEVIFTYVPNGSVEKTVVFKLDGKVLDRVALSADLSGTEVKYRIPPQTHGSHVLEFYLEADINGEFVSSNHKIKDILFYDPNATLPVIGTPAPLLKIKQYATTNIIYTVYDPKSETPTVTVKVDNKVVSTTTLRANPNYNNTPTGVYSYTESEIGTHVVKVICGTVEKVITVEVEELGINVSPITTGLVFDFNPAGRSNGDVDNRLWSQDNIHMSVSENFDWTNGGYIPDDPDGPCFCVKAGSTATINYKLFEDDAKKFGKEFKLVFKTKNVANPDAVFLSCLDNTTDRDHIGINMGVHNANIYGQSGNLELAYSEEDIIEFEFNISKNTEIVPMVMGYEDGVPSRPMVYDDTYSFKQNNPKEITIGSPDCDIYIYRFKVYNTSLTDTDILNNFVADARTAEEMISRYNRNQIYDENHKLTPDTLAEKCPWLRVYKVSAPHFTSNKSDKVDDTTIQQLFKNGDPILDNWICYNAQHAGQGTSSNNYGASGRNLDFIMNKSDSYFELGDGTTAYKITLTRESVPVAYLNAKVNIASSNNLTNAILAKKYNDNNPYRRPFVAREGINTDFIKDTMEFHNCVIFIQETDPDLTTHREFADNDWHFYAIGNIGDSKKTDDTRATDPNDKYECCVEIMDVGLPLSDFPVDTMINAMGYSVDEKTGERIYLWAKQENLGILYELIDGEYVKTEDTEIDLAKTYYVDILENDDFSEDYTYGWRYISDDEDPEILDFCKQKWIEFYRFVTTSSDEEFRARLSEYFVLDSALYYYLFTTRYCMVDNRAKNTFWHYSKTADGTRKWDLCWDYDNDTSLGLNNYGKQVYRYGLEDIDKDSAGEEVFRESDSTFFCRIRDNFSEELKRMYNDLESKNAWHAESFLNTCDAWQSEFPEELWRLDIERKYLRTYTSSFINGKGDSQFLVNMCNGRMKYHRRQWERNQEQYMSSKYQTIRASGDSYHANFRFGIPNSDNPSVPANYQLTLTPFSYIYLNVHYGGTAPSTVRAEPNVPTVVPFTGKTADIVNVYNASAIRDFGDLSACYPKTISIGNASRVKKLTLGNETEGYDNAAFTTLTTGSNPLLEEINIENISSLSQALNLDVLTNLKKLYAFGTNIPSVIFANGGKIEEVELPAVNNITLKQLKYLTTENFKLTSYDNVIDLVIEECPSISQVTVFNNCTKLRRARLVGVDFGRVTYEYFNSKVFGLKGLTATGEETANAILIGTARFDRLTGSQFDELRARYPQLEITYDYLESTITFKDTDLETVVHQGIAINAADYRNPVYYEDLERPEDLPEGMIYKPMRESNAEFDYIFLGWSTTPNIIVSVEDVNKELTDEDRRAFKEDAVKRVEGDRTLYPVFESIRRSYPVRFINPTTTVNGGVLQTVQTLYGYDATYTGIEPRKLDAASPDLYAFSSWYPKPENIKGSLDCFAQFTVLDSTWKKLELTDITDCSDHNGNIFDGYELNRIDDTMAITKCKNKWNAAVLIPETMSLDSGTYTINKVGGFDEHTRMELVQFPETLKEITSRGFYNCYSLFELNLPESLQTIGMSAFQNCSRIKTLFIPKNVTSIGEAAFADCKALSTIEVDEENPRYVAINKNCLIDTRDRKLLQGLSNSEIPLDGSITCLGQHCYSNTNIVTMTIPEGIVNIPNNAFSRCYSLTSVKLPDFSLESLDATCFAWCNKLTSINLPEGLKFIYTYVFDSCALSNVLIPSTVEFVLERAFGDMSTLKEVTFKKRLNPDGTIYVPEIHEEAFVNSGSDLEQIVFNLPWSAEATPLAPWGAKNAKINFDYVEEEN